MMRPMKLFPPYTYQPDPVTSKSWLGKEESITCHVCAPHAKVIENKNGAAQKHANCLTHLLHMQINTHLGTIERLESELKEAKRMNDFLRSNLKAVGKRVETGQTGKLRAVDTNVNDVCKNIKKWIGGLTLNTQRPYLRHFNCFMNSVEAQNATLGVNNASQLALEYCQSIKTRSNLL